MYIGEVLLVRRSIVLDEPEGQYYTHGHLYDKHVNVHRISKLHSGFTFKCFCASSEDGLKVSSQTAVPLQYCDDLWLQEDVS